MLRTIVLGLGLGLAVLTASTAFAADVKVTGIHCCCGMCVKQINSVLEKAGAKNIVLKKGDVSFSADEADKTVQALFRAGYAGKTVEGAKTPGLRSAEGVKGKSIKVDDVHLCCGQCAKLITAAVASVGKCEPKAGDTSITVTSENDIEAVAVIKALRAAGFNGRVAK